MASNSTNTSAANSGNPSHSKPSSNRRSRPSSGPSGAAAEPEPSEVPSTRTATAAAATGYNVRDYQNPDAGAADQPLTKAAKGKTKGVKGVALALACCHCGKSGAKLLTCGQCHRARYCDRECQRRDWKRHRRACRAAVAAEATRATRAREATAAARAAGGRPAAGG